jgi:hypothetical protein
VIAGYDKGGEAVKLIEAALMYPPTAGGIYAPADLEHEVDRRRRNIVQEYALGRVFGEAPLEYPQVVKWVVHYLDGTDKQLNVQEAYRGVRFD